VGDGDQEDEVDGHARVRYLECFCHDVMRWADGTDFDCMQILVVGREAGESGFCDLEYEGRAGSDNRSWHLKYFFI
jgi:hypothetical protein